MSFSLFLASWVQTEKLVCIQSVLLDIFGLFLIYQLFCSVRDSNGWNVDRGARRALLLLRLAVNEAFEILREMWRNEALRCSDFLNQIANLCSPNCHRIILPSSFVSFFISVLIFLSQSFARLAHLLRSVSLFQPVIFSIRAVAAHNS